MNDLQLFKNQEFEIRTVVLNEEVWFVAKDIAEALGYSNSRKAIIDHVDEEDKNTVTIRDGIQGNPNQVVINESGMYSLVLSSKLDSAKRFKRWVTSEVLPSIRKNGYYVAEDMSKELRAIIYLDKQQQEIKNEIISVNSSIAEFKDNMPLFAIECDSISKEVKKVAVKLLGGINSPAYMDTSLRSRVFSDIYTELKRQFSVSSYKAIKRVDYDRALSIIRSHSLPLILQEDISDCVDMAR